MDAIVCGLQPFQKSVAKSGFEDFNCNPNFSLNFSLPLYGHIFQVLRVYISGSLFSRFLLRWRVLFLSRLPYKLKWNAMIFMGALYDIPKHDHITLLRIFIKSKIQKEKIITHMWAEYVALACVARSHPPNNEFTTAFERDLGVCQSRSQSKKTNECCDRVFSYSVGFNQK